jgi:hypothetical protein
MGSHKNRARRIYIPVLQSFLAARTIGLLSIPTVKHNPGFSKFFARSRKPYTPHPDVFSLMEGKQA